MEERHKNIKPTYDLIGSDSTKFEITIFESLPSLKKFRLL